MEFMNYSQIRSPSDSIESIQRSAENHRTRGSDVHFSYLLPSERQSSKFARLA